MSWLERARGLPDLEPEARARLEELPPARVPAGTVLFRPGEAVKGFVLVLSGRVEVFLTGASGREILLYAVEPGQSCIQSTLGLMGGEDYSAEAITVGDCELVLVPRDQFLHLLDLSARFRSFVFSSFAHRMQSMMHLLEKVAFQRIESRLSEALLKRAGDGEVHATHAELAVMIGSAREVVSRRLDALARRGILKLERGIVRIVDEEALQALSDPSPV